MTGGRALARPLPEPRDGEDKDEATILGKRRSLSLVRVGPLCLDPYGFGRKTKEKRISSQIQYVDPELCLDPFAWTPSPGPLCLDP